MSNCQLSDHDLAESSADVRIVPKPIGNPKCVPQAHCALTLAARITLPQVSISNLIRFANSSGVLATTS
jgi:hypothetical protein